VLLKRQVSEREPVCNLFTATEGKFFLSICTPTGVSFRARHWAN